MPERTYNQGTIWPTRERSAVVHQLCVALEAGSFAANPYNPCVPKKIINGKCIILVLHVSNILAFHVEIFHIIFLVAKLAKVFKCNPEVKRGDMLVVFINQCGLLTQCQGTGVADKISYRSDS